MSDTEFLDGETPARQIRLEGEPSDRLSPQDLLLGLDLDAGHDLVGP